MSQPFRSFVRVRPFINGEATICPEGSPVPRGALVRNNEGTISVLDPAARFRPKKNGIFGVGSENLLWSFVEDGNDIEEPLHDQQQVYDSVVAPVIPRIVEGYNAAFLVYGANECGRSYTMFGPASQIASSVSFDNSGESAGFSSSAPLAPSASMDAPTLSPRTSNTSKGFFYRFCGEIFSAYQQVFAENSSSLSVEVEVVEIVNDQYHDLLNPSKQTNSQAASHSRSTSTLARSNPVPSASFGMARADDSETIKVVLDPVEGSKLSGVTRANVSNGEQLEQVVRSALKPLRRRKSTHVVHLRLTETFEFSDPADIGNKKLSKARRVNVIFALLHALPPSFHRCVDVAIERDSGEKPSAMVPYRDSAFTKLYADIFMQGYNTTFVNCVSPYFEHVKDAMNTLTFALKIRKIRCNPKLNQDESLVELRKLSDEVKGLKSQVVRENESLNVVQSELDRRERDIINREYILAEQQAALSESRSERQLHDVVVAVQAMRKNRGEAKKFDHIDCLEKTVQRRNAVLRGLIEERLRIDGEVKETKRKSDELEVLRLQHEAISAPFQAKIVARNDQEEEIQALEVFVAAEPDEKMKEIAEALETKRSLSAQVLEVENEKKNTRSALGDAKIRLDELKPNYDAIQEEESRRSEVLDLKKQLKSLEDELHKIDADNERLQREIDKAPSQGCCTMM
jgi:hypothetical protein